MPCVIKTITDKHLLMIMITVNYPFSGSEAEMVQGLCHHHCSELCLGAVKSPSNLMTPTKFVEAVSHPAGGSEGILRGQTGGGSKVPT